MEQKSEIWEELQMISPVLANAGKGDYFSVPESYFAEFPQYMADQARFSSLVPAGLAVPMQVPAGYFTHLSENIVARIEIGEELAELPLLESVGKANPFYQPAGYFDAKIAIPSSEPAKLRSIKPYRKILQYAAAAMLGGILVSGAFMYTDSKNFDLKKDNAFQPATDSGSSNEINSITDANAGKDIEAIVGEKKAAGFVKKIQSLTDDEMNSYLEENSPAEPIQIIEEGEEGENTK